MFVTSSFILPSVNWGKTFFIKKLHIIYKGISKKNYKITTETKI